MKLKEIPGNLSCSKLHIGIVVARFNPEICKGLLQGALRFLKEHDSDSLRVTQINVAGALEIPIALHRMASTEEFDVLVALGAVIRGETYHFEVVSNESARGVMSVSREWDIPIGNGILTCDTDAQALARMEQKGYEAVAAAVEVHNATLAMDE